VLCVRWPQHVQVVYLGNRPEYVASDFQRKQIPIFVDGSQLLEPVAGIAS
jgi:hypothetical protein